MSGQHLLLQHHGLKGTDALCLSAAILVNFSLTFLDLSDNSWGDKGAVALASALTHNSSIQTVLMRSGHIGWKGGTALGKALEKNKSITHLDMHKNRMGDRACSGIISALKTNPHVRTLNLADNQLGIKTSVELRDMLMDNITLTDLDLSWNHIRPQDLYVLSPGLKANNSIKTLSLAWNGIGDKAPPSDLGETTVLNSTQKSAASKPASPRRPVTAAADAGDALVALIRQNQGITDLDVSNCRLGSHMCKDLASAIASNRSIQFLLLDGNPFGDGAVDILKELKTRMLDGSLSKFSMDNCCFDPTKRNLDFDEASPNGYYRLDLAESKEREIAKKLLSECKHRKQDIFRNEKLDGKRLNLTKKIVQGGYDGNWKGWEVCCVCVCVRIFAYVGRHAKCVMLLLRMLLHPRAAAKNHMKALDIWANILIHGVVQGGDDA